MINLEIIITLSAMMLAFFVSLIMLQKSSARKYRVRQDFDTLELAQQLNCDTRKQENMTKLGLKPFFIKSEDPNSIEKERKAVFYLGVFYCLLFVGWSVFLAVEGLISVAAVSMAIAVVSVVALMLRERKIAKGKTEIDRLRSDIARYEENYVATEQAVTPSQPVAAASLSTIDSVENSLINIADFYNVAERYDGVPTDSTLRRHFLSEVVTTLIADAPEPPTDSTLKRHYLASLSASLDNFLATKFSTVAKQAASVSESVMDLKNVILPGNRIAHFLSDNMHLPEDCTLRRHYLAGLHDEIEQCHGERPSDSSLKRHFDTMVDREMEEVIHYG